MYVALDRCGITVEEIFEEVDRRFMGKDAPVEAMAFVMRDILFERFNERMDEVAGHRVCF